MKNIGTYRIYLTGSKKTVQRSVKQDGDKYFVVWYKKTIEVKRGTNGFYTVESY